MEEQNRIRVTIESAKDAQAAVSLGRFLQTLADVQRVLVELDRSEFGRRVVSFEVVKLSRNSPATVDLMGVVEDRKRRGAPESLVKQLFGYMATIAEGKAPSTASTDLLDAFRVLAADPKKSKRGTFVSLSQDGREPVDIARLGPSIDKMLGEKVYVLGSYSGTLEAINLHGKSPSFYVYPTIPTRPKLRCVFGPELRAAAIGALDQFVTVYGRKEYTEWSGESNASMMVATRLEVHSGDEDLPRLSDLYGVLDMGGDMRPSEQIVRELRDEW